MRRRLLVLRHAHADPGGDDHARPLSPRGRAELASIRDALRGCSHDVAMALCSPAVRAVATLEGVRRALPASLEVVHDEALYLAGAPQWLERCRDLHEAVAGVLLVGHNPGLAELIGVLTQAGVREPSPAPAVPPGALAELLHDGPWGTLGAGTCRLAALHTPT